MGAPDSALLASLSSASVAPSPPPWPEETTMNRPVASLPEEFLPIVRQTARAMLRRGLNRVDAEDLEQAVSLRAWLSLPRYSPEKGPLGAYLQTVVKRAAANFLRDRRASRRSPTGFTSLQTPLLQEYDQIGPRVKLQMQLTCIFLRHCHAPRYGGATTRGHRQTCHGNGP